MRRMTFTKARPHDNRLGADAPAEEQRSRGRTKHLQPALDRPPPIDASCHRTLFTVNLTVLLTRHSSKQCKPLTQIAADSRGTTSARAIQCKSPTPALVGIGCRRRDQVLREADQAEQRERVRTQYTLGRDDFEVPWELTHKQLAL